MSKTSKMLCTECNRLNGTHVKTSKIFYMQCDGVKWYACQRRRRYLYGMECHVL